MLRAWSAPCRRSVEPGTSGTPAACIDVRARLLSPITSIDSAVGPTKIRSLSSQARTNAALSARKPQPGWTASQPVVSAAATRFWMCR